MMTESYELIEHSYEHRDCGAGGAGMRPRFPASSGPGAADLINLLKQRAVAWIAPPGPTHN
jgi:hypothetical protein